MQIRVNGKMREVAEGITISDLLAHLNVHPLRVAVQLNTEIIKRERYGEVVLKEGDVVEVLTLMAGGYCRSN